MKRLPVCIVLLLLLQFIPLPSSAAIYDLSYTDLNGNDQSFGQYVGEHLVVEAFSTECSHCIDYHPILASTYQQYQDNITLVSVSINGDDTAETIRSFMDEHPTNWTMGLEVDESLTEAYNLPGTPMTLLFSPQGKLQACLTGTQTQSDLSSQLDLYLNDTSYSHNLEEGVCPSPTLFQQFLSSIFFPITMALLIYGGYILIKRFRPPKTTQLK